MEETSHAEEQGLLSVGPKLKMEMFDGEPGEVHEEVNRFLQLNHGIAIHNILQSESSPISTDGELLDPHVTITIWFKEMK